MRVLLLITAFCLSITACKKSYTCSCVSSCSGDTLQVSYDFKSKQKDADEACAAYATTSGGCVRDCQLK